MRTCADAGESSGPKSKGLFIDMLRRFEVTHIRLAAGRSAEVLRNLGVSLSNFLGVA